VGAALTDPSAVGQTYELGGPTVYSFEALMLLMLAVIERRTPLVRISFGAARRLGQVGDLMARTGLITPPITSDQVELLRADNVVTPGALGLADLGVSPTPVEAVIATYLYRYRKGGQYAEALHAPVAVS
jgi:NADH dehydrogenase